MSAGASPSVDSRNDHRPPVALPEAAAFLGVSERWLRRAVHERRLPYLKVGHYVRFLLADLEKFLTEARVEAQRLPDARQARSIGAVRHPPPAVASRPRRRPS